MDKGQLGEIALVILKMQLKEKNDSLNKKKVDQDLDELVKNLESEGLKIDRKELKDAQKAMFLEMVNEAYAD